jgi:hypothetical protein
VYAVEFKVLQGCCLAVASLALNRNEVSVHASDDVRNTRPTKAIGWWHEVVDAKLVQQVSSRTRFLTFDSGVAAIMAVFLRLASTYLVEVNFGVTKSYAVVCDLFVE